MMNEMLAKNHDRNQLNMITLHTDNFIYTNTVLMHTAAIHLSCSPHVSLLRRSDCNFLLCVYCMAITMLGAFHSNYITTVYMWCEQAFNNTFTMGFLASMHPGHATAACTAIKHTPLTFPSLVLGLLSFFYDFYVSQTKLSTICPLMGTSDSSALMLL